MIEWVYKEVKCLKFLTDEPRRKKQPLCPGVDDPATAHGVMLINSKLHSVCGRSGERGGVGLARQTASNVSLTRARRRDGGVYTPH